ncbi:MAG: multidrug transporter [Rhizobiales bacterium NRL2]|jgi:DHA2 family multidrug resistance protein|nr:MAG: multidrug transporter [Rhizobiales bacterium NRL2]
MSVADGQTAPAQVMTRFERGCLIFTLTMSTMLYAMTVTIANVALPKMQGAFGATTDQIAWVVTFNLVATAVVTPMTGWLIARLGQRRVMLISALGFTGATLACGMANSLPEIVFYRVLQGMFGAPMVPGSQSIVLQAFPREKHASTMAVFGVGVVLGPIIAPTLGGYLSETYGWRWVFFMVVPCALVAIVGILMFVRDLDIPGKARLDWTGFLALSVAVAATQLMLDRGERADWFESPEIIIEACIAALAFWIFVSHSLTSSKKTFLDFQMLKDRNFAFGMFFILIFGMLNFTPMVLFPPMLQQLRDFPEGAIGWLLATRGLGTLVGFIIMIWASRLDPRFWMTVGFGLQGIAGLYIASFDINLTSWDVAWTSAMQGLGVGLCWVPVTQVAFATLGPEKAGEGSSVFHLIRNFGSSFFISVSVAVVIRTSKYNYSNMAEEISPMNDVLRYPSVIGGWNLDSESGLAAMAGEITRQSLMVGYINAFYLFAIISLATIPFFWMVKWQGHAK